MHSPRLLLLSVVYGLNAADPAATDSRIVLRRWVIIGLAVGIALDLVIGLTLGPIALEARRASSQAHLNKVAAYQACLQFNEVKSADLARWDAIVKLIDSGPANPETVAFVRGVEAANKTADRPVDCTRQAP